MQNTKIYNVHILEGSTIKKYTNNGQYVEDFMADLYDGWVMATAENLHKSMLGHLRTSMTLDELQEELDSGSNCIVIDHSVQQATGQIIVHFTNEPEVIGQAHAPTTTLQ